MQAAVDYDNLVNCFPTQAIVNAVFAPPEMHSHVLSHSLLKLRHNREEDMIPLVLFVQRMDTPSFLPSVDRERVISAPTSSKLHCTKKGAFNSESLLWCQPAKSYKESKVK